MFFLTKSIRRKLCINLGLIFVMLVTLIITSVNGLYSYRFMISELDFSINQAPRTADVVHALNSLFDPLRLPASGTPAELAQFAQYQSAEFSRQVDATQAAVEQFQNRLARMPSSLELASQDRVVQPILGGIKEDLQRLQVQAALLKDPQQRPKAAAYLVGEVADLTLRASRIPDPSMTLIPHVDDARKAYRTRFAVVLVAGISGVVLFFVVFYFGFQWIFKPVRILRDGARRIANGDTSHQVVLKSNDEMAELATVFNQVTARFNDMNRNLDRKVRDQTELLVRSERVATLGFFAAGVAHEINNPLSAITMAAESLLSRLYDALETMEPADADVVRRYLAMIEREAQRCQGITTKLLEFARGNAEDARLRTNLIPVVNEVLELVQHMSKFHDRKLVFQPDGPLYAEVNPAEIKQVLLNLIANALDATDDDGTIEVEIAARKEQVEICVRDNGIGMTPETARKVFDPFYTSRRKGHGTGLGLSICLRIVEAHGGELDVTSEGVGKGSTFRMRLPCQGRVANARTPAAA